MAKLEILTSDERKAFDAPPKFMPTERDKVFQLPDEILTWIQTFDSTINQVGLFYSEVIVNTLAVSFYPRHFMLKILRMWLID